MPLLVDLDRLRGNLELLWAVIARTGARILLDQTAFPAPPLYPVLGLYLSGTVGRTRGELEQGLLHMDRDSHGHPAPDCSEAEFQELLPWCSHLTYATLEQWRRFDRYAREYQPSRGFLVRVNGCCAGGVPLSGLPRPLPKGISNLSVQLTQPDPALLAGTLSELEDRFHGPPHLYLLDVGGGWPLTDPAFPLADFEALLRDLRGRWRVQTALTVGEAVTRGAVTQEVPAGTEEAESGLYLRERGAIRPFSGF